MDKTPRNTTKTAMHLTERAGLEAWAEQHSLLEHLDRAEIAKLSKKALIDEIQGALLRVEVFEDRMALATDTVARPVEEIIGVVAPAPAPSMTRDEAIAKIDRQIDMEAAEHNAEYGERWYTNFADLKDRFVSGYREALAHGDDYVTVKVPSFHELGFSIELVKAALGR